MMLDTAYATTSQFTTLNTWQGTPQPVTVVFDIPAWVRRRGCCKATRPRELRQLVGDLVTTSVSIQPDGPVDWGQVVALETAITIDGNGTAVDGAAASANGGVAHIHSTAFSGLTNNVVTIEHSVDGVSSWATLVTFATITAVGSERVVVAPGTTVRRYLRVVDNVTGSGSTPVS
jgi:hypothetical protein